MKLVWKREIDYYRTMKQLLVMMAFIFSFKLYSQETYTIKVIDADSKKGIKDCELVLGDTSSITNMLGYVQLESKVGENVELYREGYISQALQLPEATSFQVALTKYAPVDSMKLDEFYRELGNMLRYPKEALIEGLYGIVFAVISWDERGRLSYQPLSRTNNLFNVSTKEALWSINQEDIPFGVDEEYVLEVRYYFSNTSVVAKVPEDLLKGYPLLGPLTIAAGPPVIQR
jgi:hypothetical protein